MVHRLIFASQYSLGCLGNQPVTASFVANRINNFSSFQVVAAMGGGSAVQWGYNNSANHQFFSAGTVVSISTTDSAWHANNAVINGASSVFNVDGTETTGNTGANNPGTSIAYWGQNLSGSQLTGYGTELGLWFAAVSGTNRTTLCHNQYIYW